MNSCKFTFLQSLRIDPQYKDALYSLVKGSVISIYTSFKKRAERPSGPIDLQTSMCCRIRHTESEPMVENLKGSAGEEVGGI